MLIANPIYDRVFKRLMEDTEAAKFIISTLLDQPVESIETKAQELTYIPGKGKKSRKKPEKNSTIPLVRLMRLDFVATIKIKTKTDNGETYEIKKVLIEMQKALNILDVVRFRDYLGEHYKRQDIVDGKPDVLPIINIYILDDRLPFVETACVRVNREYYDAIHRKYLGRRDPFIECLSHDCVVVQTPRIDSNRYETELDRLLTVFEQKNFVDKEIYKDYTHPVEDENIRRIIDILHYCASNAEERKKIETEHEAWRVFMLVQENNTEKLREQAKSLVEKNAIIAREQEEKKRIIVEKEAVIAEKEAVIVEKEAVIVEKEAVIAEKEAVIAEKEAVIAREQEEKKRIIAEKEALIARFNALKKPKNTE